MIVKEVILITAIIAVCGSSYYYADGICPAREHDIIVVVPNLRISSEGLNDEIFKSVIQKFLAWNDDIDFTFTSDNPTVSCKKIAELRPSYKSGYYWIQGASGVVKVYCEMGSNNTFGQSGGWMRIANVDMRNNHSQCPPGLVYSVTEGRRLCRKPSLAPGCSSTTFSTQGVRYEKVCGKVIGYQYYRPYGFGPSRYTPGINETYVDGVSLTHGSPRQHVWTFADATDEIESRHVTCPCLHPSLTFVGVIPGFVGEDYYCETGSRKRAQRRYYFDDPLWDGEGCEGENECCDRGGPWFCKQLPQPTQDDIEMRVCTNNNNKAEDVVLEQIVLYVQ
jgi:hypothetical protein